MMGWNKSRFWLKKLCPWSLLNLIPIPQNWNPGRIRSYEWRWLKNMTKKYYLKDMMPETKPVGQKSNHIWYQLDSSGTSSHAKKTSSRTLNGSVDGITWASVCDYIKNTYMRCLYTYMSHIDSISYYQIVSPVWTHSLIILGALQVGTICTVYEFNKNIDHSAWHRSPFCPGQVLLLNHWLYL